MDWLTLALCSAFTLASADAATKAWLQGLTVGELTVVRFGVSGLLLSPLLVGLPPLASLPPAFWGYLLLMIPVELAAILLYMAAIRDYPLSLTLPYLAFTPVFVIAVAWWVLGERVSVQGAVGVLLVVAGAWLLNGEQARAAQWRSWVQPFRAALQSRGSRLMLIVAALYAVSSTLGKGAMQFMDAAHFGAFYFGTLGLIVTLVFALPRPAVWRRIAARPGPVFVVGALIGVMAYTHFLAIAQVEVAYMVAVKRTSLLFGILYGVLLFKEGGLRRRLPAGVLMVTGVVLILL